MIEAHFGESAPFSIGVEEEVMILDGDTFEPVGAVDVLLRGAEAMTLPGSLKTELHASIVELTTGICESVEEAVAALAELRAAADGIARANGLRIAAAGAHPTARLESLPVVQEQRYLDMIRIVGYPARRQGVSGLHVHVGMPSAERCYETLEAVLPWLPAVLALSANSPFLEGEATGMWSNRSAVLAELPRAGAPPAFGSYVAWEAWVERLSGVGLLPDYTRLWWDVRPHPRLGTLEIRMPDQPTSLERTALIVEAIRRLAETALPRDGDPARRGDYAQNRWAAARFGLDAELVHPDGDRIATARELAWALLGLEPPEPEAARQCEVGVERAAADLADRTLR
ncbi:MAG: YbdK family carboxylate-amine ligase [Actinobacteria bacterium]|nr:MAG: YbdK family carboxylate-amine ligase [Actinomycetota bacterium]